MAQNKFGIDTILAHVKDNTLLEPNRYELMITGPIFIPKRILLNCHRCSIPTLSVGTFDHSVIGPTRKFPNAEIYDELSTSFYLNEYVGEVAVMNTWIKKYVVHLIISMHIIMIILLI